MKGKIAILLLVVFVAVAALGGVYYLFSQQDQVVGKTLGDLKTEVSALGTTLKGLDAQVRGYDQRIIGVEGKINGVDAIKQGFETRMSGIEKAIEELRNVASVPVVVASIVAEPVVAALVADNTSTSVNLGEIPVQK